MDRRKKQQGPPLQEISFPAYELLMALSRAAHAIQMAHTPDDFYQAVGKEMQALGGEASLLMMADSGSDLSIAYTSFSASLIHKAEKLTGLSVREYRIPIKTDGIYERVLKGKRPIFLDNDRTMILDAVPDKIHPMVDAILNLFRLQRGILAPLYLDQKAVGFLKMNGKFLNEESISVVESFASQIAAGLHKVHLIQKMQEELDARIRAEEALKRNRNLLLALSRAAQAVQQAHTLDDVYQAVGEQIKALGHDAVILFASDDQQYLTYAFSTLPKDIIQACEKLTGLSIKNYRFLLPKDSLYGQALKNEKGYYDQWTIEAVSQAIPDRIRPLAGKLIQLLRIEKSIIVPLSMEGKIFGTLTVASPSILKEDIPAIESFAAQVAIQIHSTRLAQQARQELIERKLAEEKVRKTEIHFRALIENATDGIMVLNPDGTIRYASPGVTRILGYETDAMMGMSAFQLIHPADLIPLMQVFLSGVSDPGFIHRGEYRFRRKDGEWGYLEIVAHYLMNDPVIAGIIINGRDITLRKQSENALQESERKFHGVITNSADGIALTDEEGRIIEFNNAFEEITGCKREEVLGKFMWELHFRLLPPPGLGEEKQERFVESVKNVLKTGQSLYFQRAMETPITLPNGSTRIIQQRLFSIRTEKGWRVGSISRDSTESKRVENIVRASEEWHRVLYEDNPSIYFTTNAQGIVLSVNRSGIQQLGFSKEELIGQAIFTIFHPDDREAFRQHFTNCIQNVGVTYQIEARKIHQNGRILWVRESACAVYNRDGGIVVLLTCGDITSWKEAEDAARRVEERFHALIENAPDGVALIGADGAVTYSSPAARMIFGYHPDHPINATPWEYIHPEDSLLVFRTIYELIQNPAQISTIQYRYKHLDGSWHWVESVFTNLLASPDIQAIVINFRDITDRKNVENSLRLQFENLNILYRITATLSRSEKLEDIYSIALTSIKIALAAERASILLFDTDGVLRFKAWDGLSDEYRQATQGHSPWTRDTLDPHPLLVPDVRGDASLEELRPVILAEGIQALGFIPLTHLGKLLGKFMVYYDAPRIFSEEEIQLAQTLAQHVSFAIARKHANEELLATAESLEIAHRELQEMFAHEQMLARTDGLTGLCNRRYFFEIASREFNAAQRYQRALTIILMDVDGFKQINDTLGHAVGDIVLTQVGKMAASQLRSVDTIARYGGDEFIILLPETNSEQAQLIAERIRETVASHSINTGEKKLTIFLSIGIAETIHGTSSREDTSIEDIIRRADGALYKAKRLGRNRIATDESAEISNDASSEAIR